ncbi:hypothetical protein ACA910_002736 [Epithemia clementina (nom. ined.)]
MSGSKAAETAKAELVECEKEINSIKASVRLLGSATAGAASESTNSLSVVALKIDGLPDSYKPKLALQLSSPVEEATLTELFDPEVAEPPAGMKVSFRGVETGQATLTLDVIDGDSKSLGSSEPLDLAPSTKFDAMAAKKEYESDIVFSVKSNGEAKEDVCTVTLRLTFVPSATEKREQLYELLSVAAKKKAAVVEKLRKASMSATSTQAASKSSPAVKAGFLNKPKQEESKIKGWYNAYLGPQSFVRRNFSVIKNYVIFFGAVGFFHFQGHVLALPPPV